MVPEISTSLLNRKKPEQAVLIGSCAELQCLWELKQVYGDEDSTCLRCVSDQLNYETEKSSAIASGWKFVEAVEKLGM